MNQHNVKRWWWPIARLAIATLVSMGPTLLDIPAASGVARAEVGELEQSERPLRTWHFAEGNGHAEYQTYFSLLNLADQPASVTVQYQRDDGIRLVQWLGIEPHARLSFHANEIIGQRAFGASFFADQDIVVERSTIWGPGQHAETSLGFAPGGKRDWHFAEGTTRGLVSTYFVLLNLDDLPTTVAAVFTKDDGGRVERSFMLPPRARAAFRVDDLLPDTAFAASFAAERPIVVERTITREGSVGIMSGPGYAPVGDETGSRRWAFAEGSTRRPYLTYFVLFNPNQEGTEARLRFSLEGGGTAEHSVWIPGQGRIAFDPSAVVPAADFGVTIETYWPIDAERTYFSTGEGLYGALGYTDRPIRPSSRSWYFAEGNTTGEIETYFLVSNLTDQATAVRATYYTGQDAPVEREVDVPAGARISIRANDVIGQADFSARFLADREIVVERTIYFPGWGGFIVVGAGVPQP
jgi:hypothetical protein